MPYETGAKVRLTRDVQVTADDTAARSGLPGPLFLAEGLRGVVTGAAERTGGGVQDPLAAFDHEVRGVRFDPFAAGLIDDLRQRVIRHGASGGGAGGRIGYRVRFENGFVLDGLREDWLTGA
ncbi:hypothetical protein ABZ926_18005 [Streptomyces litmocidini]|uniref:Uncharacterized protein n=1 Tax=Streptomyces litmocidini TaxID=67318 RepID=A0ABW7UB41_9ACTN|nr:hypothetical protein [Streptomyces sp. PanSC19]ROQ27179.1 hypothetical protein EDD98_6836 [Streptomyces sp. PanSC19]